MRIIILLPLSLIFTMISMFINSRLIPSFFLRSSSLEFDDDDEMLMMDCNFHRSSIILCKHFEILSKVS